MPATSATFDGITATAAQVAAGGSRMHDPRSSWYHTDKGLSRMGRLTIKLKKYGRYVTRPVKKVFGRGKKDEVDEISGPASFVNPGAYGDLVGNQPPSNGTAISIEILPRGYSARNSSLAAGPVVITQVTETTGVTWVHPPVTAIVDAPSRPSTGNTSLAPSVGIDTSILGSDGAYSAPSSTAGTPQPAPFPVENIYKEGLKLAVDTRDIPANRKAFAGKLDNHPSGPRPASVMLVPGFDPRQVVQVQVERPASESLPPRIGTPVPFDTHISGFGDYRKTYYSGMFDASSPAPIEVANASGDEAPASEEEILANRDGAFDTLNRPATPAASANAAPAAEERPRPKPRARPVTDTNLPDARDSAIYFPYNSGIGEPIDLYPGSRRPSSGTIVFDHGTLPTFSSGASTAPSSPGFLVTPGLERHSLFVARIQSGLTFTPDFPGRPANPEPSVVPGSLEYLEGVYTSPPPMDEQTPAILTIAAPVAAPAPAPVPAPQPESDRDSLQVPKIARKPVPFRAYEPSNLGPGYDKPLPAPPAPGSARLFTPATETFPSRVDSLNNPVASFSLRPAYPQATAAGPSNANANASVPVRYSMNENGHQIFDQRASAVYEATPAYEPRRPMNEMEAKERDQAAKREVSRKVADAKAATKAKAKAKKKLKKDEDAVEKLMCRNQ